MLRREDHTPLVVLNRKVAGESEKMLCMVQIKQFGSIDSEAAEAGAIAFMTALGERCAKGELTTKQQLYEARDLELAKLGVL